MLVKFNFQIGMLLKGDDFVKFIKDGMASYELSLYDLLKKYDSAQCLPVWREFMREVDDLINYHYGLTDFEKQQLWRLPVKPTWSNPEYDEVFKIISKRYSQSAATRFKSIYSRLNNLLIEHAIAQAVGESLFLPKIATVGEALTYLQGIRLYLTNIDPLICQLACGAKKLDEANLIADVLQAVNFYCRNITTGYYELLMNECYPDHEANYDGVVLQTNHQYTQLEGFFLEPDVLSIQDQLQYRAQPKQPDIFAINNYPTVFSAKESTDEVSRLETAFEKYKKRNPNIFQDLKSIVAALSPYVTDDYFIKLDKDQMAAVQFKFPGFTLTVDHQLPLLQLYYDIAPFREYKGEYFSTIPLLDRFIYRSLTTTLKKGRSYQTNAGFIFEDKLKAQLSAAGLTDTKIKRIKRKEFDVVMVKGGKIYNFQCKNNFIDIARIHNNISELGRLNARLVTRYEQALIKEKNREQTLLDHLNLKNIEHFVVTRFPLLTTNENIINFNHVGEWLTKLNT
jgi:hypothetical protein